jgi:hypothetical protein
VTTRRGTREGRVLAASGLIGEGLRSTLGGRPNLYEAAVQHTTKRSLRITYSGERRRRGPGKRRGRRHRPDRGGFARRGGVCAGVPPLCRHHDPRTIRSQRQLKLNCPGAPLRRINPCANSRARGARPLASET